MVTLCHTDRNGQMGGQSLSQTDRLAKDRNGQTGGQSLRQTDRQTGSLRTEMDRRTDNQSDRQADSQTVRQTDGQSVKPTNKLMDGRTVVRGCGL